MKILRVANIPDNRTGGMSRIMYNTGDLMTAMGHQVDYLFAPQIGAARSRVVKRFITPWRVAARVAEMGRRRGPYDVVEVHEPLSMWCGLRQRWDRSWPAITVLSHGLESRSHRSMLAYRISKALGASLRQRFAPLTLVWQANAGLRSAASILCSNTEDREHLLAMGLRPERVRVIHNGVSDAFLTAGAVPPVPERRGRMLFVGTWLERKGVLDLEEAAATALSRHPTARLTIAGCLIPPGDVAARFPPGIRDRIEVVPKITSDEELIDLYRRHQIFVLPSFFEGQPLVMLEAAALGLAIITTDVCGMKDFIQDGANGLLVPPGRPDRLAEAMDCLLAAPDRADRLGEAVYQTVREYTWARSTEDFLAGYEAAAGTRLGRQAGRA